MKLDILAFGAHPDDVELGCAAMLAKEIAQGKKVGIIDLTQGELGTRGTEKTRFEEAATAANILGVDIRINMKFADGFFVNDKEHQLEIIKTIRKYTPEIVICNAIDDRHIDHAKGSQLVSDACFLSGLLKIDTKTDDDDTWQEPWRPKQIYHYIQWKNLEPDVIVDVSGFMDIKMEAVMAYKTQFYDKNSKEPITPISTKNFTDNVKNRAIDMGRLIGVEYGEAFTVDRNIAVNSLFDLK
ncbi:MAG: bacillithiol biosynthesis deacetylase BshB1 [Flavobacteriales bacterium]|nr:bacillithiol biosynthesis deacetylase BshB1 [Flavobacteriia bacterium]NCP05218.1 bacillithiol biosynthesis deacetylase BshB1 [Flavobacteriales bacterium]PIV92809.1 MAG: bacillithiol biosynthesis deacetylase BshB1 [Flavobacteriaceae bacterium CG17_big_fil_post_rev_8_21_14_2_50_33_15]PIY13200.1 MAG: bacillithiol biosynthesis deacetylase BshB1 [Flavobacteriaceae bacterium CG_4_10_14_3_um_filter_33_47]PJB18246.1 MAG: bacillithiol biosynthesis deacetylase BshB1 [Flavobacteriaceae bacterium CG_4_9